MKKSARYFLKFIFMAFCLYSTQAIAFVDPPTFTPTAPNSAQAITVSVRHGICDALGNAPNPGGRPQRIEYSINAIDIFTPGFTNPSGFCNIPISNAQFIVVPRPAGTYQVRIWMLNDFGFLGPGTFLVSQGTLTVVQGELLTAVPAFGIWGSTILIALIFIGLLWHRNGTKHWVIFSITFLASSAGFAQSTEKALLVLLSAAPGAPAPISLVQPVSFSSGYLGALSPGFVAEKPTARSI